MYEYVNTQKYIYIYIYIYIDLDTNTGLDIKMDIDIGPEAIDRDHEAVNSKSRAFRPGWESLATPAGRATRSYKPFEPSDFKGSFEGDIGPYNHVLG